MEEIRPFAHQIHLGKRRFAEQHHRHYKSQTYFHGPRLLEFALNVTENSPATPEESVDCRIIYWRRIRANYPALGLTYASLAAEYADYADSGVR
jgi:hypothetical protein